jgi:hypothetical protein
VFAAIYWSLKPGRSFWIWDVVVHEPPALHDLMWRRYGRVSVRNEGRSLS